MFRTATLALAWCVIAWGCGGSKTETKGPETPDPGPQPDAAPTVARTDACAKAQQHEVDMWIEDIVGDPDDEIEMFSTLGMILTLTDPATLDEIRQTRPDATNATAASAAAWTACGESPALNCAALARALTVTETRLEDDVWDDAAIGAQCTASSLTLENADCALSADDIETAKTCF